MNAKTLAATYPGFDPSKSYEGECQVCGNRQVVNDGHLVLHGYKRPGDGAIDGRCWGQEHVPFELSCEVAKDYRRHLIEQSIPAAHVRLAELRDPALAELEATIADGYYPRNGRWAPATERVKFITVTPGYVHVKGASNDYKGGWTFERFRGEAISKQERRIRYLNETVKALDDKIASWSYRPEALHTRQQITEQKQAAKEAKENARALNAMWQRAWKGVAEAIREHKDGYSWRAKDCGCTLENLPPFPDAKSRKAAREAGKPAA